MKYKVEYSKTNDTYRVMDGDKIVTDFATKERAEAETKRLNGLQSVKDVDKAQEKKSLKEKIQELSLDQKAKLYFMGLVRKGVIDTLPEDPKAAYVSMMMDKDDYGRSISGKDKRTFMEPEDRATRADKMLSGEYEDEDYKDSERYADVRADLEEGRESKKDKLKMAYAAYNKAEMNGDIRGQELALAVIDLIKNNELKEMDSKIDALRTRRAQATIDDLNQYLQGNIGADNLVDSLQDMIKFLNQFIFENKTDNFNLKKVSTELGYLKENEPTVFDDESMDELLDIILKYVEDPDDAEAELDRFDQGGFDAMSDYVTANLDRDPEYKAWYNKLHSIKEEEEEDLRLEPEDDEYEDGTEFEDDDLRLEPEDMDDPDEDLVIIGSGYLDIKSNFKGRPNMTNDELATLGQKVVDQLHNGDKEAALNYIYSQIN